MPVTGHQHDDASLGVDHGMEEDAHHHTSALEEICDALGPALSMSIRTSAHNVHGFPFPDSVVIVDGRIRGRATYNSYSRAPSFDHAWPAVGKHGDTSKLFSTARTDEFEARVAAVARHFSVRQCDPCAMVLTSDLGSADGVAARFVPLASLADVVRTLMQEGATCLVSEYVSPPDGHHHLLRCIYSPYAVRLETRRAPLSLDDPYATPAERLALAPAGTHQFDGFDTGLQRKSGDALQRRGSSAGLAKSRSDSLGGSGSNGDLGGSMAASVSFSRSGRAKDGARPDSTSSGGAPQNLSGSAKDPVKTATGEIDPLLSPAIRSIIYDALLAMQSTSLLPHPQACVERAVFYVMVTGLRSVAFLWCSQYHALDEQLPNVATDLVGTFGPDAAKRIANHPSLGGDGHDDAAHQAAVASGNPLAIPRQPVSRPQTPLAEHQAIGDYIDMVATMTSYGVYEGQPEPTLSSGIVKQLKSRVKVVGPVAAWLGASETEQVAARLATANGDDADGLLYSVPPHWGATTFFTMKSAASASSPRTRPRQVSSPTTAAGGAASPVKSTAEETDGSLTVSAVHRDESFGAATAGGGEATDAYLMPGGMASRNRVSMGPTMDQSAADEEAYVSLVAGIEDLPLGDRPQFHTGRIRTLRERYVTVDMPLNDEDKDAEEDDGAASASEGVTAAEAVDASMALAGTWRELRARAFKASHHVGRRAARRANGLVGGSRGADESLRASSSTPGPRGGRSSATALGASTSSVLGRDTRGRPQSATPAGLQLRGGNTGLSGTTRSSTASKSGGAQQKKGGARRRPEWCDHVNRPSASDSRASTRLRKGRTEDDVDKALLEGADTLPDYDTQLLSAGPLSGYLVGDLVVRPEPDDDDLNSSSSDDDGDGVGHGSAHGHRGKHRGHPGAVDLDVVAQDVQRHKKADMRQLVSHEVRALLTERTCDLPEPSESTSRLWERPGLEMTRIVRRGRTTPGVPNLEPSLHRSTHAPGEHQHRSTSRASSRDGGARGECAALALLQPHPSVSEAALRRNLSLDPSLVRTRDLASMMFAAPVDAEAVERQRRAEEAARREYEDELARASDDERRRKLHLDSVARRRQTVIEEDASALQRLNDEAQATAVIEQVGRVVEAIDDLIYDARARGGARPTPSALVKMQSAPEWAEFAGPQPPVPTLPVPQPTSHDAHSPNGATADSTSAALFGGAVGASRDPGGAPSSGGSAATELPKVVTVTLSPRTVPMHREMAAILVGVGFVAVPLKPAARAQWYEYHAATGGTLGVDGAQDLAGSAVPQLDVFGVPRTTSTAILQRHKSSMLAAASPVSERSPSPAAGASGSGGEESVAQRPEDGEGAAVVVAADVPANAPTFEYQLKADSVAISRALSVVVQYRLECHRIVESSDPTLRNKVRQLVEQMGYAHFDAVAAAVKNLKSHASVAHSSLSFTAMLAVEGGLSSSSATAHATRS